MVVQHNINAMTAYNKLNANVAGLKKSSEKLASGYRINRAGDDAAGLAISEKMRSQIRGLNQAVRNSQDGINMIQTFEGAAQGAHNILQRMKELASESSNGTYDNTTDRDAIQLEFDHLNDELNQMADTDFNGRVALNGGVMADGTHMAPNIIKPANVGMTGAVSTTQDITYYKGGYTVATDKDGIVKKVTIAGNEMVVTAGSNANAGEFGVDAGTINIDGVKYDSEEVTGCTDAKFDGQTVTLKAGVLDLKDEDLTMTVTAADGTTSEVTMTMSLKKDGITYYSDAGAKWYDANGKLIAADAATFGKSILSEEGLQITKAVYGAATGTNGGKALTLEATLTPAKFRDGGKTDAGDKAVSVADAYENGRRNLTYCDTVTLQTGARSKDAVEFTFAYDTDGIGDLHSDLDISARGLGTDQLTLTTPEGANYAIDQIDNAINKVSMVRATFGSIQNRLEHKIDNLTTNSTNLSEAESNIRDTDMASEMMNYTKYNILQQAAQSMLAQANQQPQSILQLLG